MNCNSPVIVIGAGLQGSCTALELAQRGLDVILMDRDEWPMNRTSLRNEGKIHLGLVYANDRSLATANLMLQGALHFYPLLTRWIGTSINQLSYSTPFYYLVATDSVLLPAQLSEHYGAVQRAYEQLLAQSPQLNYLGYRPQQLYCSLDEAKIATYFQLSQLQAGFQTVELAVDTEQLAVLIRQAIASNPRIQFLPLHQVKAVERGCDYFQIEGVSPEGLWKLSAQQVVNATWENRLAIDRSVGLEPASGWLHRLKYRVVAHLPDELKGAPSATMVIGRYGDVVIRPNQTVYLSWYPAALQGWSNELSPPPEWNAPCRGEVPPAQAQKLAHSVLSAIEQWFPGISKSSPFLVDAGAIFAHGYTDVDDRKSGLHDRTRIGVTSVNGYHSSSTGKLTTAPLFAVTAANRVINTM
uniref:FAD dependent oxidoreductase n=1 Tax=Cyanothece sp. (strain PCC 7425 / ATCC 29141) TaxID=395961 RepID=B8HSA3_CYAP4